MFAKVAAPAGATAMILGIIIAIYEVQEWKMPTPLALTLVSILFAMVAILVVVVLGELRKAFQQFLEGRQSVPLGKLDYMPELKKAATEYVAAQEAITSSMTKASPRIQEEQAKLHSLVNDVERQKLAAEIAREYETVTMALKEQLPVMVTRASTFRQASLGWLREAEISNDDDLKAINDLRNQARDLRTTMYDLKGKADDLRQSARFMRKQNISASLNEASRQIHDPLRTYRKVIGHVEATARRVDWAIRWKTFFRR